MRQLVPKGSRLHFRRDRPPITRRHRLLIAQFLRTGELQVVVGHARIATARHERRARVRLLTTVAAGLVHHAVGVLVIESRGHRDIEDDHTLLDCRRDGVIGADLLWHHDIGPMTSRSCGNPDALAGVLASHLLDQDEHGYLEILPDDTLEQVLDLGEL